MWKQSLFCLAMTAGMLSPTAMRAGSLVSGSLYEKAVVQDTVLTASGSKALAMAGTIDLENARLIGSIRADEKVEQSAGFAIGRSSVRLGGVRLKDATLIGTLSDRSRVSGSIALALKGDASIAGIDVEGVRFAGSLSSSSSVSGALAMSVGGWRLFFVPQHVGGVRIH